ncbi:hypothetical protein IPM62_01950 [Candidatus Woesebacteria bacterium]|nr:MAG: hypothetical protein IPM62_01950 [Candidatus Woesebacteria bacterium]
MTADRQHDLPPRTNETKQQYVENLMGVEPTNTGGVVAIGNRSDVIIASTTSIQAPQSAYSGSPEDRHANRTESMKETR